MGNGELCHCLCLLTTLFSSSRNHQGGLGPGASSSWSETCKGSHSGLADRNQPGRTWVSISSLPPSTPFACLGKRTLGPVLGVCSQCSNYVLLQGNGHIQNTEKNQVGGNQMQKSLEATPFLFLPQADRPKLPGKPEAKHSL